MAGIFRRNNDEDESGPETVENESDDEEPEMMDEEVTLVYDNTVTFEYTEHKARIGFTSGDVLKVTFDEIEEKTDAYVMYNYEGVGRSKIGTVGPKKQRKILTVQKENLNYIETVDRIERENTDHRHDESRMPLSDALDKAMSNPEVYSIEEMYTEVDEDGETHWHWKDGHGPPEEDD